MKKFLLPLIIFSGIIGTGNPMESRLEEANQNQVIQTQVQVSEDDFNSIIASVFHQLYAKKCKDIISVIVCHLDGKSFSALTQSCKYLQEICKNIPTHFLINTNFAEAACSGNTPLLRRFIADYEKDWTEAAQAARSRNIQVGGCFIDNYEKNCKANKL